jgi:hypothetical protein
MYIIANHGYSPFDFIESFFRDLGLLGATIFVSALAILSFIVYWIRKRKKKKMQQKNLLRQESGESKRTTSTKKRSSKKKKRKI